jgi:hypothetical protein
MFEFLGINLLDANYPITIEQFEALGVKDFKDCYKVKVDQIRALGPDFTQVADLMDRYQNTKDCPECQASLKEDHGHVCAWHYHDYVVLCSALKCKSCFLITRYLRLYPEQEAEFLGFAER